MALYTDLTQGNVRGHLLRFAFPLVISNLFQALYNAVDMIFVGQFTNPAGLSAVSVCGPIMNILIMTISGLSVGVSIVIAAQLGQGRQDRVKAIANTCIAFYGICALALSLVGWFLTPAILAWVNTPVSALPGATDYLRTIFLGLLFMFGYNLIGAFQRGFGDSRSSMLFIIVATLANILLDYIFVGLMHMGPLGAAVATVMAQALSFLLGLIYFRVKDHVIRFRPREIRIHKEELKYVLKIGLPSALHQLLLNLSLTIFSGIVNAFGVEASAAYGVGVKVDSFATLPSDAINAALASFGSQNIGAKKPERAFAGLREALKISVGIAILVAATAFFFAPGITALFNQDPQVIEYTITYLHITCFSYVFFALVFPMTGFIRGTGNVMYPLKNVILSQYIVRIPVALLATHLWGFTGVGLAILAGPIFSTVSYSLFIHRKKPEILRLGAEETGPQS